MDYLNPLDEDMTKLKLGELSQKEFNKRYAHMPHSKIKKSERYVNMQLFFGDLLRIGEDNKLAKKTLDKLMEFKDLLVKAYYENEKITFSNWKGQKIVTIKEGKMSYVKNDTVKLIRVIFYGKRTREE